jgi:thymidylate synthase ThyX
LILEEARKIMETFEEFTPEEKKLLAPFVTNTDQSVFVLQNLPEVIKGALFSRYSRSTLGLRKLLLKDFILKDEASFQEIQGGTLDEGKSTESRLAIQKAQSFYDRILDGYGDDSIGELGGAHVAMENVSILATKEIEDARIGGSPLEKSTRYVKFNQKVKGDYLFYKDPKILNSKHRELYLETNRLLFDTYSEFIKPTLAYVKTKLPREEGVSEAAYNRALNAKTYDLIRGILPASTLTNMGCFGNGRFFESLIARLNIIPMSETNEIGDSLYNDLHQAIPSFIRRSSTDHKYFKSLQNYTQSCEGTIQKFCKDNLEAEPEQSDLVKLVDFDADAEDKMLANMLYASTEYPLEQIRKMVKDTPDEKKESLLEELISSRENRRHKPQRYAEEVFYTFDILGDYGMYRDLHRHRTLTQERQPLSTRFGYFTPPELEEAGLGEKYHAVMKKASEAFETIYKDFPKEAQYVVPLSYNIRWYVKINLRALIWLVELRSTPQGHENYRKVAQEMFRAVEKVQPNLAKMIKFVDLDEYSLGRLSSEIRLEKKRNS